MSISAIYHTSPILRKHQLLIKQVEFGKDIEVVDWETYKASKPRVEKYLKEVGLING
jgi:hypothetical protein